jgi:hypothetical protein
LAVVLNKANGVNTKTLAYIKRKGEFDSAIFYKMMPLKEFIQITIS